MTEEADIILRAQQAIEQTKRLQAQVEELRQETKQDQAALRSNTVQRNDLRAQLRLERARMVRRMTVWISAAVVFAVTTAVVSAAIVNDASRRRAASSLTSCEARETQIDTLISFFDNLAASEMDIKGLDPTVLAERAKVYAGAADKLRVTHVNCRQIFHEAVPFAVQGPLR